MNFAVSIAADSSATEVAPWWGVPVLAGSFLILGGALSATSAFLIDRRRTNHENSRRDAAATLAQKDQIRAAAAKFLVETRRVFNAYTSNFALDDDRNAYRIQGEVVYLEDAQEQYWNLFFVLPEDAIPAARELHNATRRFGRFDPRTRELRGIRKEDWIPARDRFFQARTALVSTLEEVMERRTLDAPSGDSI